MTLAETIYHKSLELPPEKAREVLDFIESLGSFESGSVNLERPSKMSAREILKDIRIDFGGKPMLSREEANARR